jgi:hypothetical protein
MKRVSAVTPSRSLEDRGYLGMLLATPADMGSACGVTSSLSCLNGSRSATRFQREAEVEASRMAVHR